MTIRLVLFGAPGSGKGTQAELLVKRFDLFHISTGNILRQAIAEGNALGKKAQSFMDKGFLVPDEIVVGLVDQTLKALSPAQGFVFDGFPRTLPQAEMLDRVLGAQGRPLTAVISLDVLESELVRRISGRRVCPTCAASYHMDTLPEGQGSCPKDSSSLIQRPDDQEEAVKARLEVFARQTLPLKIYYRERTLLRELNGFGKPLEVFERIEKVIR